MTTHPASCPRQPGSLVSSLGCGTPGPGAGGSPLPAGVSCPHTHPGKLASAPWDLAKHTAGPHPGPTVPCSMGKRQGLEHRGNGLAQASVSFYRQMDLLSSKSSKMKPETRSNHLSSIKIPQVPGMRAVCAALLTSILAPQTHRIRAAE